MGMESIKSDTTLNPNQQQPALSLTPFVYWAQSESHIFLKVDLHDVKDPDVELHKKYLAFESDGVGARGSNKYSFHIDFNSNIVAKSSTYKIFDSKVQFVLEKASKGWWSRLTCQPAKPAWLKIDFERWQSEDPDDDESDRDVMQDYPGMYEQLQKQELGYTKEDWKKVYLFLYNLLMFVGFSYVFIVMNIRYLKEGAESISGTYKSVGSVMVILQILQVLEIMHPLFGYTKGNAFTATMQVMGRALILLCLIDAEPRMQVKPVVFYLFCTWTSIEIIRYPYYLSTIVKRENKLLTWLRYTAWIPLYPVGFLCEGVVMLRSFPYLEETGRFSVSLPNWYNFAFYFPTFLRIYMTLFMLPGMYVLMTHMYKLRKSKLGPKDYQPAKIIKSK